LLTFRSQKTERGAAKTWLEGMWSYYAYGPPGKRRKVTYWLGVLWGGKRAKFNCPISFKKMQVAFNLRNNGGGGKKKGENEWAQKEVRGMVEQLGRRHASEKRMLNEGTYIPVSYGNGGKGETDHMVKRP